MKIHVRVGDETYEVEVGDLSARPVVTVVDGMRFEIWPEETATPAEGGSPASLPERRPPVPAKEAPAARPLAEAGAAPCTPAGPGVVRAPIPGVIESVAAQAGQSVVRGQELAVLEAMKMKNLIRAPRAGTIAAVYVTAGQHVKHGDPLVELQD